jgi:hypothetical protein
MNSVLHHFCKNVGKPGSGAHSSISILQELKPPTPSDALVVPAQYDRPYVFDQLEEALKGLDALGYRPVPEEGYRDLFHTLELIISEKKPYRQLLLYKGERAQLVINALQWVSSLPSIEPFPELISLKFLSFHPSSKGHKGKFMQALLRLSTRALLLPQSFGLSGIEIGEVLVGTSNVDIFKSLHEGRKVCLKKYRVFKQSRSKGAWEGFVKVYFPISHVEQLRSYSC